MEIRGWNKDNNYTMSVKGNKVVSILVENRITFQKKLYKRTPEEHEDAMNRKVFEEAILAICQKNLQVWENVYHFLCADNHYGQELIQKIFARHFNI